MSEWPRPKGRALTLGETMLRICPKDNLPLEQAREFVIDVAGCESNVAVGLARMGAQVGWLSKLPRNPLGRKVAGELARHGVDVSPVIWSDEGRVGTYYVEFAPAPRGIQIYYDRRGSAISQLAPEEVDWELLSSYRLLHLSGITPALGETARRLVQTAIAEAQRRNVAVSFDVNYRRRLWTPEEAAQTLQELLPGVTLLLGTREDFRLLFGLRGTAEQVCRRVRERFGVAIVAVTLGEEGSLVHDGLHFYASHGYRVEVVDRIGAGDAYAAGLLYGYLADDLAFGARLGSALAALCLTYVGDVVWATPHDVERLWAQERQDIVR